MLDRDTCVRCLIGLMASNTHNPVLIDSCCLLSDTRRRFTDSVFTAAVDDETVGGRVDNGSSKRSIATYLPRSSYPYATLSASSPKVGCTVRVESERDTPLAEAADACLVDTLAISFANMRSLLCATFKSRTSWRMRLEQISKRCSFVDGWCWWVGATAFLYAASICLIISNIEGCH